jgi:hypothetical protein
MKKYCDYIDNTSSKNFLINDYNNHYIYYSNNNYKNYCDCMKNLKDISVSELKYIRKINIIYNHQEFFFNISDIHIEIDFELLGVNETNIFFELFNHIKENMILNKEVLYIVCLHFNNIKKELLDIFYNFMNDSNIKFIFLTNNISFINDKILKNCCIKKCKSTEDSNYNKTYKNAVNEIYKSIISYHKNNHINIFQLREKLYQLLIMNYNIYDSFYYLITLLIKKEYINNDNIGNVLKKYIHIIEKYNNNYRTIYHLEHFIIYLININNTSIDNI